MEFCLEGKTMNISTVKKIFAAGAVLVFSAVLLTGCGGNSASSGDKKFLNIGTGGAVPGKSQCAPLGTITPQYPAIVPYEVDS